MIQFVNVEQQLFSPGFKHYICIINEPFNKLAKRHGGFI